MPTVGSGTSSSQRPTFALLFTSAFIEEIAQMQVYQK
jgi:hypothetical protein